MFNIKCPGDGRMDIAYTTYCGAFSEKTQFPLAKSPKIL